VLIVVIIVVAVVVGAVAMFFLAFFPFTQITGSESMVTKGFELVSDYSRVNVEDGFEVTITQSNSYSISITTDSNVMDSVEVSVNDQILNIGLKPGIYVEVILRAEITMPDLEGLDLSGGSRCTAKGFSSSHQFDINLSGGSSVTLEGAASVLAINSSGGSRFDLSGFPVHDADINIDGGGRGTVNLDGRLVANLSGGSQLSYLGEPTSQTVDTSDGSSVRKVD
jgi:hypothetical protein